MLHLYRPPTWHPQPLRRPVRLGVPPVLAGLDFQLAQWEFGQRTGLAITDFAIFASTLIYINVFADSEPMGAPIFSFSETTGANGRLARRTHASLVAGTFYRVMAAAASGGTDNIGVARMQAT